MSGLASSQVPTLEEKTVAEHRPPKNQADDKPILDELSENGESSSDEEQHR